MTEGTPKKHQISFSGFSPVILPVSPAAASPQRNLTGTPRIARDITADLYNNIQKWNDLQIKGAKIVKQIVELKADNLALTPQLESCTNDLYEIVTSLVVFRNCFNTLTSQLKAIAKLEKTKKPLFISLELNQLVDLIESIANAYKAEFSTKEIVLENIAFAKNKHDAMFFAVLWTHQLNITGDINFKLETLLVETGHKNFI